MELAIRSNKVNTKITDSNESKTGLHKDEQVEKNLFEKVDFDLLTKIIKDHNLNMEVFRKAVFTISTNSDIVSGYPILIEAKDKITCCINELDNLHDKAKEHFSGCVLKIGEALKNYGVMTENSEIISAASIKDYQLKNMSDLELLEKGFTVFRLGKSYLQSLYAFDNLKAVIDECYRTAEIKTGKIENQTEREDITSLYQKTLNQAKSYLTNHVDVVFNEVKEDHPAFYLEYKKARMLSSLKNPDTANENSKQI